MLLLPFRKRRRASPALHHETLLHIMQYAGSADAALLAMLSTHWRQAASEPSLRLDLSQKGPASVLHGCTTVTQLKDHLARARCFHVKQLRVPPMKLCKTAIEMLRPHCRHLTYLDMQDARDVRTPQLQAIAAHLKGLTTFIMRYPSGTFTLVSRCIA